MKKLILILIIVTAIASSCSKDEMNIDPDNLLLGVWNYVDYQDNAVILVRGEEFMNNPGYRFNPDGTLIERKNSGWCGTPPVTYSDFEGQWTIVNDTLIDVNVGFWGGTTNYLLDIDSLTPSSLKVTPIYENN